MDLSSLVEKFKDKKYAVPIVVGTGVIVVYAVASGKFSGGGSSSATTGFADAQAAADKTAQNQAQGGSPSQGGSGDNTALLAGIGALEANQQNFMSGIVDYLNNFGQQISAALGSQSAQTQASIDAQQKNLADIASQIQGQQASGFGSILPDFASFYQGVAETIQPQTQQVSPGLNLGGGGLMAGLSKLTTRTIAPNNPTQQNYLGGKRSISPQVMNSFNRLGGGSKTVIPSTRGNIVKTYNSPNIQSRGGFGGSRPIVTTTKKQTVKAR